jgi:hypothetical protein
MEHGVKKASEAVSEPGHHVGRLGSGFLNGLRLMITGAMEQKY